MLNIKIDKNQFFSIRRLSAFLIRLSAQFVVLTSRFINDITQIIAQLNEWRVKLKKIFELKSYVHKITSIVGQLDAC
jgi:hypothetical protein